MTARRWQLIQPQPELAQQVSEAMQVSPLVAQLLLNRQIRSHSHALSFLSPPPESPTPLNLPELPTALAIIQHAITHQVPILVYGDYDVDGMTSTAIMVDCLRQLGGQVTYYLPNRFTDGYGLTHAVIDTIQSNQIGLLITLDCGVTNVAEIQAIKTHTQAQVLVFDHHTLPPTLPPTDAMVNPKQLPPDHPMARLCTAGLVYHVVSALIATYHHPIDPHQYLDLAALGTVADVVPLIGENRRLVYHGLPVIASRQRLGLRALLTVSEFNKPSITTRDIGFVIAPRLNASGRLASAMMGVKLLLSTQESEAMSVAQSLHRMNEDRQAIGISMLKDATTQAQAQADTHKVIVVHGVNWHAGVIGITASRLVEQFARPVVMVTESDGMCRGSARTTGSVDIYSLLATCQHRMDKFGGHREAAGFSLHADQLVAFRDELHEAALSRISDHELSPILRIDAAISPADLTLSFADELAQLAPFGQGNPAPVWYCNQLKPVDFKRVGSGDHLKVTFVDASGNMAIDGIGFGLGKKLPHCYQPTVEVAFTLERNEWRGNVLPQLQLLDIR